MDETLLETERRHLRRAEELIARQEERVARLRHIGDSRTAWLAAEVLAELRQSVKLGQDRIAHLERQTDLKSSRTLP